VVSWLKADIIGRWKNVPACTKFMQMTVNGSLSLHCQILRSNNAAIVMQETKERYQQNHPRSTIQNSEQVAKKAKLCGLS